jgi:iron complex transport system ATP-binding protein
MGRPEDAAVRAFAAERPIAAAPGSAGAPYLELEALEVWLGPRAVFTNLSLVLRLGESAVILGPNGSGKSSLIRLLSRQIHPVVKPGSALRLFGQSRVNLWALRRRIGVLSPDLEARTPPQSSAAAVVLSGLFGSVGLGRCHSPSPEQQQQVLALMERLDLADLAARPFAELSQGQRRRLLLARALVHEPELLVLDEPTNGLDLRARHGLLADLRQLAAAAGTTLLLVTHQIEAIVPEIQRCVLLKQGQVVGDGLCDDLLRDAPLSALFDTPLQVVAGAGGYRQVLPAG